jgi:FtsZ-binding cell division protein ZapB
MSDERFDRLENQLSQVIQSIATMQQNMTSMQQNMTTMQQNMASKQDLAAVEQKISALGNNLDAAREDIIALRQRIESNEGTLLVTIRDGFRRQEDFINDLNYDLSVNERKTRRLNRRVSRLERKDTDD